MKAFVLSVLFFISLQLSAQRECATSQYINQQKEINASEAMDMASVENFIQSGINSRTISSISSQKEYASVIRIAVVFHVLYNTEMQNVSEAKIKAVIEALNRDFRKQNADTINTPERFKQLAADVE